MLTNSSTVAVKSWLSSSQQMCCLAGSFHHDDLQWNTMLSNCYLTNSSQFFLPVFWPKLSQRICSEAGIDWIAASVWEIEREIASWRRDGGITVAWAVRPEVRCEDPEDDEKIIITVRDLHQVPACQLSARHIIGSIVEGRGMQGLIWIESDQTQHTCNI